MKYKIGTELTDTDGFRIKILSKVNRLNQVLIRITNPIYAHDLNREEYFMSSWLTRFYIYINQDEELENL